ncbi:hypothetical protein TIFTF001_005464 [Ficus carica]|uniref:Uncharacterized protein n=1 Tax=Ficus carica TaxID=3494 RepID=A0AA87ZY99_FICCA|nr:hypothetical protein TIFTF001_005464 [Ficus carica]
MALDVALSIGHPLVLSHSVSLSLKRRRSRTEETTPKPVRGSQLLTLPPKISPLAAQTQPLHAAANGTI